MTPEDGYNIVVFGANGMLAQDLIELLNIGEDVVVRGYTRVECDISDYDDLYNCIGGTSGITNVINCAAYTDVDGCEKNEEKAFKTNEKALKYLADICKGSEIHLTHISSNFVFEGIRRDKPYLEQDETHPLSIYGKSKLAGEGHVIGLGNKGLVIRTSWLFGKHGKNFIDTVLNKLDLGVDTKIITDEIAAPTYTMDLANVIIQLALEFKSGMFNVTNSGSCSWFDFALKGAKFLDYNIGHLKPMKSKDLNRLAERPKYSVLSMNRLERTLAEPIRKWDDALYQYLLETKRIYE